MDVYHKQEGLHMAKVLWGVDPLAAELARLAADKTLTRAELTQLAKKIAAVLL